MADNDLDSASKVGLKEIEGIKKNLNLKFADRIDAAQPINEFTQAVNTHYNNFLSFHEHSVPLKENMQDLYQYISNDFKLLADKLAFNQNDKKQVLNDVVQKIDSAFKASSKYLQGLEEVSQIIPQAQAKNIIAEHAYEYHAEVVKDLFTEAPKAQDKKDQYLNKLNVLRTDTKTENKFNKIAKLNAQLQKDLNLNDRQINELNIGVGHYIDKNQRNFAADLQKLKNKDNKENISREDVTEYLNTKTAKSAQTLTQTAKEAVLDVGKRATKTVTSQWQNPSKSGEPLPDARVKISQKREKPAKWKKAERSDKNPKIAASDYRKSQEVTQKPSAVNEQTVGDLKKGKQNNVISKLQNIPKTVKNVATKPTQRERQYDAAVRGIESDVKEKATQLKRKVRARFGNKMPPEAKEFATKIGHDALEKAHAAVELAKGSKNTVKTFVKNKWQGR